MIVRSTSPDGKPVYFRTSDVSFVSESIERPGMTTILLNSGVERVLNESLGIVARALANAE